MWYTHVDYRSRRSHAIDINSLNSVTQIRLQKVECPACYSTVTSFRSEFHDKHNQMPWRDCKIRQLHLVNPPRLQKYVAQAQRQHRLLSDPE
ncbi:hypothetical protein EVAR_55239_1 [Eumeta japonica]|uniref:Uncharacterized protein n=1 Tax=Eumeta variegata TaxID=151549 RepID=A0A4C1Y4R3_EUMVA|nr:hypothetical protein EVAR_55239_1 [Eumeta japonica]